MTNSIGPRDQARGIFIAGALALIVILAGCSDLDGEQGAAPTSAGALPTSEDSVATRDGADTTETGVSTRTGDETLPDADNSAVSESGDVEEDAGGPGRSDSDSAPEVTTAPEPTAVGEYEYEDVPEPAEQELQTLCSLTQEYFEAQRDASVDDGRVSAGMQLTVVALSDQVGIWAGLQGQYPGAAEDIRRGAVILEHWDNALSASEQGLSAEERAYLGEADTLIEQLPNRAAATDVECAR